MEATFNVVMGKDKGKTFNLRAGRSLTIGRSSAADIELSEPRISRIHCQLTNNGSRVILTDLRSTNGTFLNDKRVKSAPLEPDDQIRIGSTVITVAIAGEEAEKKGVTEEKQEKKEKKEPKEKAPAPEKEKAPKDVLEVRPDELDEAPERGRKAPPATLREIAETKPRKRAAEIPELGGTMAGCRLVSKVAQEGNQVSFRAVQLSIDRPVQLKLLAHSDTASAEEIERFMGPARSAGKLSHPNIAQIHDAGSDQGVYYIIEELTEGKTVKDLTTKGGKGQPLSVALAVEIAAQVAIALDYAHNEKVMHGDIRPEKIIICSRSLTGDGEIRSVRSLGIVRIIEFGPGGYLLGGDSDAKRAILGPTSLHNYRAPEQLQKKKRIDHRADIYSLGAVLFRMVTGRPPFMSAQPEELINAILETAIQSPKEFSPMVPQSVCRIIETAMEKDADDRYQAMSEMLEELKMLTELGA